MAPLPSNPRSQYRWNATFGRYVDAKGQFVSAWAVRNEIDAGLAQATIRTRTLAEQLRSRLIGVDEWELAMRGLSKEVHLYNAAAARGGWAQLTPDDYGRAGRVIRDEYAWIRNFRTQIDEGLPLDGRFLVRTELYAQAGRETYHKVERRVQLEQGNTLERSILGVADHCDLCISEAARGWVLIGQLIPIGLRTCGRRCKCSIEYTSIGKILVAPPPLPPPPSGPYRAKYASAVMDMETCDECASHDGVVVPVDDRRLTLPNHKCTAPRKCQCTWIYIRNEEMP